MSKIKFERDGAGVEFKGVKITEAKAKVSMTTKMSQAEQCEERGEHEYSVSVTYDSLATKYRPSSRS